MSNNEQYRREIMKDLAGGNTESLDDDANDPSRHYENFDDFAQRTTQDERRKIFGKSFQNDRMAAHQIEPELQKAIASIKPNERDDVARAFFSHFKNRGLDEKHLERQLGLSTHTPGRMSAEDITKLATFAYHSHPDIFREVLAEQPGIMRFFSNPIVGAIVGAAAAKWLGKNHSQ